MHATCLLRSHEHLGNNVAMNAKGVISQTSKQQVGDRFTSTSEIKHIFEFRKLTLISFVGEIISKTLV